MKIMRILTAMLGLSLTTRAGDLAIQSFNGTGRLTFSEIPTATVYRVEWANAPTGAWHTGVPGATGIVARGTGQNVATVGVSAASCFYRVVASVTNPMPPVTEGDYLVVDLSGGTNATTYTVSYLSGVPGGGWMDAHKTTKLVLRKVPAGTFTMGYRATDYPNAGDSGLHAVTLTKDFYLGVFEVTQRQWELVTGAWPSCFNNVSYRDARPVEQVDYSAIRGTSAGAGWPANNSVDAASFLELLRTRPGWRSTCRRRRSGSTPAGLGRRRR